MLPNDPRAGLAAAATISPKNINQDAWAVALNAQAPLAGIVVADGIGSHYRAEVGSTCVARSIAAGLERIAVGQRADLRQLFDNAQKELRNEVESDFDLLPPDLDRENAFGTTAICAVETAGEIACGYVGNGGIFHLRGNFNGFPPSQLLPWNALNYLNPHSLPINGKNVMYKLLSPWSTEEESAPSLVTISKDDARFGDIIVCCTDGVYSYDQTAIGRDDAQNIWISGEASMVRFYRFLSRFFEGEPSRDALQSTLQEYLRELQGAGLVHDDCTVAVLVTAGALAFQAQLRESRAEAVPA